MKNGKSVRDYTVVAGCTIFVMNSVSKGIG